MSSSQLIEFANAHGIPVWSLDVIVSLIVAVGLFSVLGLLVLVLVYMERKVSADIQIRYGPIHVGPKGSLQLIADSIKLLTKEDIFPAKADPWIFRLAPAVMFIAAFIGIIAIPFAPNFAVKDMNVGLIYVLAVPSIGIAGLMMAGYGSYNRYAILGSLRGAAQMVSYEIPRSLSVIGIVMMAGTAKLSSIVEAQHFWYLLLQPIGFIVFFISSIAEINRVPFDLPETESELVTGYHTEYSGMRFTFFLFAEYISMIAAAMLTVVLFLGGWHGPFLPGIVWFILKTFAVIYVMMWIRWTLPRFRIDQVMDLGWKVLLPLAILNIILTGIVIIF